MKTTVRASPVWFGLTRPSRGEIFARTAGFVSAWRRMTRAPVRGRAMIYVGDGPWPGRPVSARTQIYLAPDYLPDSRGLFRSRVITLGERRDVAVTAPRTA